MDTKPTIQQDAQPRNTAGWLRIAAYKPAPGEISRELFVKACQAREIPVSVKRIGPRLLFLNASELEAWRHSPVRLTVPGDAQRANAQPDYFQP